MAASLEVRTEDLADVPADRMESRELADLMTKTLPEGSLDRMTAAARVLPGLARARLTGAP